MPLWIFTIILALPFIAEYIIHYLKNKITIINKLLNNNITTSYPKNKKLFVYTIIGMLFTGFISPLKLYPYTYFFKSFNNSSLDFILEMQPTKLMSFKLEIIILILFMIMPFLKKIKLSIKELCLFIGLFILSLIARKYVAYFLIIASVVVFSNFKDYLKFEFKRTKKILSKFNLNIILCSCIICLIYILISCFNTINLKKFDYHVSKNFPVSTVEYVKENMDYKNMKIYSDYNDGAYLLYNDLKPFIDSRAEVYVSEFNGGTDVITDYLKVSKNEDYEEVFQKYGITHVFTRDSSKLNKMLSMDKDYIVVFRDGMDIVYENKSFRGGL